MRLLSRCSFTPTSSRRPSRLGLLVVVLVFLVGAACGGGATGGPRAEGPAEGEAHAALDLPTPAQYRVQLAEDGASLALSLWLDHQSSPVRADLPPEPGRSMRREGIVEVRCDDHAVSPDGDGWTLPAGCGALRYVVRLEPPPEQGIDPHAFAPFRDAARGQWLLPGAGVFVVPESLTERPTLDLRVPAGVSVHHLLAESSGLGHVLPAASRLGRTLIGLGTFHTVERSDGSTQMRHLFDREAELDLEGLPMGIRYLVETTGERAPRALDVYWLGRPHGSVPRLAGTAALDSMVVNYWSDLADDAPATVRRAPLAVFLHQYFVVLTGQLVPPWVSTSLGQFFALEAWRETGTITERELRDIVESSVPRGDPDTTAMAAHARWVDTGLDEDYRTFHRLGLGFWAALDAHIRRATDGEKSLATVLPDLLGLVFGQDGTPPMRFTQVFDEAGAPEAGAITRRWLGWPPD